MINDLIERLDIIARMFEGHPDEHYPPSYQDECEGKNLLFALVDELKEQHSPEYRDAMFKTLRAMTPTQTEAYLLGEKQ